MGAVETLFGVVMSSSDCCDCNGDVQIMKTPRTCIAIRRQRFADPRAGEKGRKGLNGRGHIGICDMIQNCSRMTTHDCSSSSCLLVVANQRKSHRPGETGEINYSPHAVSQFSQVV